MSKEIIRRFCQNILLQMQQAKEFQLLTRLQLSPFYRVELVYQSVVKQLTNSLIS